MKCSTCVAMEGPPLAVSLLLIHQVKTRQLNVFLSGFEPPGSESLCPHFYQSSQDLSHIKTLSLKSTALLLTEPQR